MQHFLFSKNGVSMEMFVAPQDVTNGKIKIKTLCVLFPGMPNAISKEFFAKKIEPGVAFLYVHYLGSWLSSGDSSPENCRKSVKIALEFAQSKEGKELFGGKNVDWAFKKLIIIGYSFAGNIILTSNLSKKDAHRILLYSPLIFIHQRNLGGVMSDPENKHFKIKNKHELAFMRRAYSNIWRGINNKKWDEFFMGKDSKSLIESRKNLPEITVFHGVNDSEIDPKYSEYFANRFGAYFHIKQGFGHSKEMISVKDL